MSGLRTVDGGARNFILSFLCRPVGDCLWTGRVYGPLRVCDADPDALKNWRPYRESNPSYRRERAVS